MVSKRPAASATFSFVPTPSVDDTRTGVAVAGRHRHEAAEAADVAEHLGPVGGADVAGEARHGLVGGVEVDAGVAVACRSPLEDGLRQRERHGDRVVAGEAGVAEAGAAARRWRRRGGRG